MYNKLKIVVIVLFCTFTFLEVNAQVTYNLTPLTTLENLLDETSGLISFNGQLWTHNDSGGANKIYQIDTTNGQILRTITISNINNVDWEDLALDDDNIYIGDFGNNLGTRTDLRIYKISKNQINNAINDTIIAEVINFAYSDQVDFTAAQYTTNFDCEAFVSINDSLVLFTKMWGTKWTKSYMFPNLAGTYIAALKDSFNVGGLITGADVDTAEGSICLLGYSFGWPSTAFAWKFSAFSGSNIFAGIHEEIYFAAQNIQVEGIASVAEGEYIISSEKGNQPDAMLYSFPVNNILAKKQVLKNSLEALIFPNPSTGIVELKLDSECNIEVYAMDGLLLCKQNCKRHVPVDLSFLKKGCYLLRIITKDFIATEKIILN